MFMAAIGALTLEQILLFALHFPTGRLYATIWTIGASVLLLSVAVIGARRFGRPGAASALRIKRPRPLDIAVGIPLGIALYYSTIWLQQLINNHFSSWVSWYATRPLAELTYGPWIVAGVIQVLLVPIGEESFFRGFLYTGLRTKFSVLSSVVISAALFAFGHVNPAIMPTVFIDGMVLGLAFEWRGTLAISMVIHSSILACFLIREILG
jgi:membrane protease YdiL (CAAX protease family)